MSGLGGLTVPTGFGTGGRLGPATVRNYQHQTRIDSEPTHSMRQAALLSWELLPKSKMPRPTSRSLVQAVAVPYVSRWLDPLEESEVFDS